MNNGKKTLARTKTDRTHMRVSMSTGIMVTEIHVHQNLKENWMCVIFIFMADSVDQQ